jgi:hypothetical protein
MPRSIRWLVFALVVLLPVLALAQKPRPKPGGKPKPKPTATATATATPTETAAPTATGTATAPPPGDEAAAKKEEARVRFERAMALFDRKAWDAALAEFLQSRQNYATRGNTQNAAICLKNLNRFDEALDMFETLVKEFPNLTDRALVDKEIAELQKLVGTIEVRSNEPGASVVVDGRDRGVTQLPGPVRVSVGSHVVRVYKEGFQPFESRVEVAGGRSLLVEAKIDPLAQSGRLTVVEEGGKPSEVVIDNVVVGRTPWQGPFAIGDHTVFLRAEGSLGTQPAIATVRINQVTKLTLSLEPLEGHLRVEPTPLSAVVAIDGVTVGNGIWDGRLRAGSHRLEVGAEGFLPQQRQVNLGEAVVREQVTLERDPSSPLWASQNPNKLVLELFGAPGLGLAVGGDLNAACTGGCSKPLPLGLAATFTAGYELRSGIGVALDGGYLFFSQTLTGRPSVLRPVGKADNPGTSDDEIMVRGVTLGAAVFLHKGTKVPFTARLGAGALLATVSDRRTGQFNPNDPTQAYSVGPLREAPSVSYFYLAPEVRLGLRFGGHFEAFAGVRALVLVGLQEARWKNATQFVAGANQGLAKLEDQSIVGQTSVVLAPGLGLRADF